MPNGRHQFIFICGLHRSGTSLLHECLRRHPSISGFHNTGVPEDEGQHLQSIFESARCLGGPGKFGFNPASYMNETHDLATRENSKKLYIEWSQHWDLSKLYLLEKSPPNLLKTRFLQRLFPDSYFIAIVRHPAVIVKATQKWTKSSSISLLEHTTHCYQSFIDDMPYIKRLYVLRYEDLVHNPKIEMRNIFDWLSLKHHECGVSIRTGENRKYFIQWDEDDISHDATTLNTIKLAEEKMSLFGYCFGKSKVLPWEQIITTQNYS